jgi:hypothetical protein
VRRASAVASASQSAVRIHHASRAEADGYDCSLVPGLKASVDARRLADELAFAAARLSLLAATPPGLYGEAAADPDRERATGLVFLIVYLSPLQDEADPFAAIRAAWPAWDAGGLPELDEVSLGPRSSHDPRRATATLEAYRAWFARAGSQEAAFAGEPGWSAMRRFERVFERLALPGLGRAARYDLLVTLGRLALYDVRPSSLALGEHDEVLAAAKRLFAIGDRVHLERRAAALAQAAGVPIEALDLALFNWQRGARATLGVPGDQAAGGADGTAIEQALGL